jgi:hypothetical protein
MLYSLDWPHGKLLRLDVVGDVLNQISMADLSKLDKIGG